MCSADTRHGPIMDSSLGSLKSHCLAFRAPSQTFILLLCLALITLNLILSLEDLQSSSGVILSLQVYCRNSYSRSNLRKYLLK